MEAWHRSAEGDQVIAAFAIDATNALALTQCCRFGRWYQKSTELLIRRAPFGRLIREIAQDYKA